MKSRIAVFIALLMLMPSDARADWTVRPFLGAALNTKHGFIDLEQTSGDSKIVFGAAAGWRPRAIGVEFDVGVLPGFFEGPEHLIVNGNVTTMMANVTWQLPKPGESSRLRAYIAGGVGVARVSYADQLAAYSVNTSLGAANVGGGVLVRWRPRLDVTVDARYFKTQYEDAGRAGFSELYLSFTRLTGGVLLRF